MAERPKVGFQFGMVFPADDLVSEWLATLSMAFNDLALVWERMVADQDVAHRFFYWLRLAIAHFYEVAKYLDDTSEVDEVRAFIATLSPEAQEAYATCLARYREHETPAVRLRNQSAFHYPPLQPGRANRPMRKVLEDLAGKEGTIDKGATGTIGGSRLLYADDITSNFFVAASGGEDELAQVHPDISEATTSFMSFTNAALNEWFVQAEKRGAKFFDFGGGKNG
jgi:hypothetical protein